MVRKARSMFPVGLGFGLVLVSIGATALWVHRHSEPSYTSTVRATNQSEDLAKRVTPEDVTGLKAEIERLKDGKAGFEQLSHEMTALRSQLTQVEREQKLRSQAESLAPQIGDTEANAATLTPEEEQARTEAQIQTQVALLEGTLLGEKSDSAWGNTAQLALNTTFHSETMAGVQLMKADCRTTLCRLELFLDGSTAPEDSFRKLVHSSPWQGQGFVQIDGESGKAVVYLAREGYSLPQ